MPLSFSSSSKGTVQENRGTDPSDSAYLESRYSVFKPDAANGAVVIQRGAKNPLFSSKDFL